MWEERSCSSMNLWLDILEQHFPKFTPLPPQEEPLPMDTKTNQRGNQSPAHGYYCSTADSHTKYPKIFRGTFDFFSHYFKIFIFIYAKISRGTAGDDPRYNGWQSVIYTELTNFICRPLYWKPRYYPLHRRMGGYKRCGEQKNILPRPPIPYPGHYNDRQVS